MFWLEDRKSERRNSGLPMIVCYRILRKLDCSSFNIKGIGSKKHFFLHQQFFVIGSIDRQGIYASKSPSIFILLNFSICICTCICDACIISKCISLFNINVWSVENQCYSMNDAT